MGKPDVVEVDAPLRASAPAAEGDEHPVADGLEGVAAAGRRLDVCRVHALHMQDRHFRLLHDFFHDEAAAAPGHAGTRGLRDRGSRRRRG